MRKFSFNIPNFVDTSAFAKVAADAAKLSVGFPESTFKSYSAIAAQQSRFLASMKPMLDMQSAWKKQFDLTNSDFFKTHVATRAQFAKLGANLTRTIDFGVSTSVAKIAQQFAAPGNVGAGAAAVTSHDQPGRQYVEMIIGSRLPMSSHAGERS